MNAAEVAYHPFTWLGDHHFVTMGRGEGIQKIKLTEGREGRMKRVKESVGLVRDERKSITLLHSWIGIEIVETPNST